MMHSQDINPLNCLRCNLTIKVPVRLPCLHYFCRTCVDTGKCYVCARPINSTELVEDKVLSYVVESSQETTETCANCDQISRPMFFCETCQQPLCTECRETTHKAKIFYFHNIVQLEERGRVRNRPFCNIHNEPYILFCLDSKSLMCIECFNSTSLERRGHFVNTDVAHKICCEKLEKCATNLRTFQSDLKEQIELCRRLIVELEKSQNQQSTEIEKKCDEIIEGVNLLRKQLIDKLTKEKAEKEKQITSQLVQFQHLENPVSVNLLSISIFCSYASKIDVLHCYADLYKTVQQFLSMNGQFVQKVKFDCSLNVDFLSEFNKIISIPMGFIPKSTSENAVFLQCDTSPVSNDTVNMIKGNHVENNVTSSDFLNKNSSNNELIDVMITGQSCSTHSLYNDIDYSTNFESSNFIDQRFSELFQQIAYPLRRFAQEISLISRGLLDLQKDITLRRCVINGEELMNKISCCEDAWNRLEAHNTNVQKILNHMGQHWRKGVERVQRQQSIVRDKIEEMKHLRLLAQRAFKVSQQFKPFAAQMANLISVIDIRRLGLVTLSPMEQICFEISRIEPDSLSRVAAIEKEEESRRLAKLENDETQMAMREAVKTKNSLKEVKTPTAKPKRPQVVFELDRERSISRMQSCLTSPLSIKKRHEFQSRVHRNSENEMGECSRISTVQLLTSDRLMSLQETELEVVNKSIKEPAPETISKSQELSQKTTSSQSNEVDQEVKTTEKTGSHQIPKPIDQLMSSDKSPENNSTIRLQIHDRDPSVLQVREKLLASIREKVKRID